MCRTDVADKPRFRAPNVFSRYGVTFRRLAHEHIEMLRNWRNDPRISRWMGTQQYIEPEAQEKWFESIKDRDDAFYYIVYRGDAPFGYWNIKDIDWNEKNGEPGLFIYDDEVTDRTLAYRLSFCSGDLGFDELGLESVHIHVLKTNKRAQRFNISLGYVRDESYESEKDILYRLSKKDYYDNRDRLLRALGGEVR